MTLILKAHILQSASQILQDTRGHLYFSPNKGGVFVQKALEKTVFVSVCTVQQEDDGILDTQVGLVGGGNTRSS